MSQQVNNNLRRSKRIRFTPVFLAEEQSQEVTFATLQSISSTTASLLSRIGSESRGTSSPNIELSNFHRGKKRIRQASPTIKISSNVPLKLNNDLLVASKSLENAGGNPFSQLCLVGDKKNQKLKPQAMHTSTLGCASNGFVHVNFSSSTEKGERINSSFYSLILQPKNAAPCYNLKSKKARVSDLSKVHHGATGMTTSDPQMIPKQAFSHPTPEQLILSPVCSSSIKGGKGRKTRANLSQFQIVHDEIPCITRLRQIGLYFCSDLDQNVEWADVYLHKTGISRQNYLSLETGNDNGSREQRRGARERKYKRGKHCSRYRAMMNLNGVCLNLGTGHSTSAEAAAALDLGQCLLKGSENQQTPAVLSRPEMISGLQAAGLSKSHGDRADPLPSFKVNEVTKVWFESMVENALTSLGGMDYQLSYILADISEGRA